MRSKKDLMLSYMLEVSSKRGDGFPGFTTAELSSALDMQRSNTSNLLNILVKENQVTKRAGKPVLYQLASSGLNKGVDNSAFQNLIGSHRSLKNAVQLAKAAIIYPEGSLNTLIVGESGTGKSYFSRLMYEFAIASGVVGEDAQYVKFNCSYYANKEDDLFEALFSDSKGGAFQRAQGGVLFIDHVDLMSPSAKNKLFEISNSYSDKHMILICALDGNQKHVTTEVFYKNFPIHIELPSLAERSFEERLELVEHFFMDEANKVKKEIRINSEVLRCFLLYHSAGNVKQLKNDIKIGCANAYVRELSSTSDTLRVFINDCHSYIRKGFIFYKKNRAQIEALIPENYTYAFTGMGSVKMEEEITRMDKASIYDTIERRVSELRTREVREEDIMTIVSADIESDLFNVKKRLEMSEINRDILMKLVDKKIIDFTDDVLKQASLQFKRVFPSSTFYGICMHLSSALSKSNMVQNLSNEKILEIVETYKEEYTFSSLVSSEFETIFHTTLTIDDIIFMTIFLSEDQIQNQATQPSILIAMHGSIASSIANTVNMIYKETNIYAYDLLLDKDMDEAYEELKNLCRVIDDGGGILVVYDMGSIRVMMESIIQETGIHCRMIEMPVTMLLLDCAIKLSTAGTVDAVYEDVLQHGFGTFGSLQEEYHRSQREHDQVIITLCQTGEGSALQIKQYLERNLDLDGFDVVALAVGDPKALVNELNRRHKNQTIMCIVGTYNPKIHDIPFISVAQLFDAPVEKLPMLLAFKDVNVSNTFDYSAMYEYLDEQLPEVDLNKLKRHLPRALSKISKVVADFTINEEVGLFMHIACSINRIKAHEPLPLNIRKDKVINSHKKLYHSLKAILAPLEAGVDVQFNDDELATIIEILS